ncbi:MAG: MMPL family transporter [Bifidobacteriaceae bacterium]|nr:MMPL family transporter [Bifidobacteriaceae bacterium]
MFLRLARGIIHHPAVTVLIWVVVTAGSTALAMLGIGGESLFDRVNSGAPVAADSDSATADDLIAASALTGQSVTLMVSGLDLDDKAATAKISAALVDVRDDLGKINNIAKRADGWPMIIDPLNPAFCPDGEIDLTKPEALECALANPVVAGLVAEDRNGFLMTADVAKDLSEADEETAAVAIIERLEQAAQDLPKEVKGVKAAVGGEHLILTEIVDDMKHDLALGEFISMPVALIVMILVFAGFLAAAMPVVGALTSIFACMGAVYGLTYVTDIHTSVINVISLIGLGLSIDYGLLAVSRFREEIRRIGGFGLNDPAKTKTAVRAAVTATVTTAGRTVFYSALTIALCIAGLMAFKPSILRTFGLAGLIVVLLALATALTLVPALLVLLGKHLTKPSLISRIPGLSSLYAKASDLSPDVGIFSKLTRLVQKHPWWVTGGVLAVLVVLALPIRNIELRNSTVELLPQSSPRRAYLEQLEENYPLVGVDAIQVISLGSQPDTEKFAKDKLNSVAGTKSVPGADGQMTVQRDGYVEVTLAVTEGDPEGPQARAAVQRIRDLAPPDYQIHVTGPAARLTDFEAQLAQGGPIALAIITVSAFILLFLFTGSVLIPVKALITNALSLAACLGVVTWIFQGGHFGSILGFTAVGGIETYILVLLLIFGFGLAMDYEVFLISRIKESWDLNHDPQLSVSQGLQHSGRIITSAALIIVMVFLGFAAGRLVMIKEIGIGLALAVALDATLVRMLLVPATMSLLGKWNWWAPKPLARLHARLGLSD